MSKFGFHFALAGLNGYQGPHNPAEEFFTGREYSDAVARECIQNSLDARAEGSQTVHVEFRLTEIPTEEIPDLPSLRFAMGAAATAAGSLQGASRLQSALKATEQSEQWLLSISDYGTTGLNGTEEIEDQKSPLSILTRGSGASSNDSGRGGSFGIGSAVGPMASSLSTVFYRTQRVEDPSVILAGMTRLASHKDSAGNWRVGSGYYTDLTISNDFSYPRDSDSFPTLPKRTAPGTDVLIVGYSDALHDSRLERIREAVAANFFAAISAGNLTVAGHTAEGAWQLDQNSLATVLQESSALQESSLPFYRAMQTEPITEHFDDLGDVHLYIYEDDTLQRALGTLTMRKPLMRIMTFRHQIPAPYAAVLVVPDEPGNSKLRDIEPPEHNAWNSSGPRSNRKLVDTLKGFVRDELRKRFASDMASATKVKGLEKFLPAGGFESSSAKGETGAPRPGQEANEQESGSRMGRPMAEYDVPVKAQGKRRLAVKQAAVSGGDEDIDKGQDSGGDKPRSGSGGELEGKGVGGDGTGRISAGDVDFRSFAPQGSRASKLVLVPKVNTTGSLTLAPLGATGNQEEHDLVITKARVLDGDEWIRLDVSGMTISKITLIGETPNHIEVEFNSGRHYRLGVK